MNRPLIAMPVVGAAIPPELESIPGAMAEPSLVNPERLPSVEAGLNEALARTGASFLLPVQSGDRIRPAGLQSLLDALRGAPAEVFGAAGATDRVSHDGSRRRSRAVPLANPRSLDALRRTPGLILFRTGVLRSAGGWRPGEAAWGRRPHRHRALLARLLAVGATLLAVDVIIGVVALPHGGSCGGVQQLLRDLLYRRVAVTCAGGRLTLTGRVAAVSPELLTLATGREQIALVPMSEIAAVRPFPTRAQWP